MSRKLEIVRSLMHRPAVLFLDEPTSGLDPISRRGLWDYLREVRNEDGTTVFLTTHYLDEAEEADRVCVIDHGKVAVDATPDELKNACSSGRSCSTPPTEGLSDPSWSRSGWRPRTIPAASSGSTTGRPPRRTSSPASGPR